MSCVARLALAARGAARRGPPAPRRARAIAPARPPPPPRRARVVPPRTRAPRGAIVTRASPLESVDAALATLAAPVPESVPRPLAKALVGVVAFFAVSLVVRSIVSTVALLALVAGAAYVYANKQLDALDGGGEGARKPGDPSPPTGNDALDDANRIMDKYR